MPVQFDKIVDNKTSADVIVDEITGCKEVFNVLHKQKLLHGYEHVEMAEVIFHEMMKYVFDLEDIIDYHFVGLESEVDTGKNAMYYYYEIDSNLYCIKMYAFYNRKSKFATICFEPVTRIDNEVVFDVANAEALGGAINGFKKNGMELEIKFTFGNKTKIL